MAEIIAFKELRSDWYASNQFLPRLVRGALENHRDLLFVGFPRQWIPLFRLFGLRWEDSISPPEFVPIISDLSEEELVAIVECADAEGVLRSLAEAVTMLDPILSDFLYIVDQTVSTTTEYFEREVNRGPAHEGERQRWLLLNGWQSYGRPSVRALEAAADGIRSELSTAAVLPCSLQRPYGRSRTHRAIYEVLHRNGYDPVRLHKIVLTSLGVLPEEIWHLPEVLSYDAGVPDIYRLLRLSRRYFSRHKYGLVLDCLQFEPYSDILRIIQREGIIHTLERVRLPRKRAFYIKDHELRSCPSDTATATCSGRRA